MGCTYYLAGPPNTDDATLLFESWTNLSTLFTPEHLVLWLHG